MDRFKSVKIASILGIIGNIFLLVIKAIVGFMSGSQAMIADSFNSAGDIFSSLLTFIGNKIASKPYDEDHNLGHGKAEYIFSMLISIAMILMSLVIIKDAILSLIYHTKYEFSIWLVVVCIVTICVKFALFIYTNKMAKKLNNLLIKANSEDHRNDCIVTSCNLASCLLSLVGIFWIDGVVGIGISTWILISAAKIFIQSYDVLMDKSFDERTKQEVYEIIKKHKEIQKVTHFNATPVGYQYQISFSIFVDGNMSTFESHEIADKLEKEIDRDIDEVYLTVIHVNPI